MGTSGMNRSGAIGGRALITAAGMLGAIGLALGGGCMGYSNMNTDSGSISVTNPNARTPSEVVREALRYVVGRYPAGGRFAVNLVKGTQPNMADFIMRELPAGAELVSEDNADLPTYHVGVIRIRMGEARVDIIRPVVELGELPGGGYSTQAVTVHLEGGLNPWRVTLMQRWALGAVEIPERWYVGGENAMGETPAEESAEPVADTIDETPVAEPEAEAAEEG
ncbi:MAG: hypothetical protein ACI89L_000562 [Phycisphaerales bacterium]|jgi:hypothetical protein